MNGWITMLRAEWDRVAGWLLVIVGASAVVLAFLGVADSPYVSDQLAYIASGGVGGLVLVAVGVGLLISADLHDEWRKLDRIEAAIRGDALPDAREVVLAAATPNGEGAAGSGHRPVPVAQRASLMQLVALGKGPWPSAAAATDESAELPARLAAAAVVGVLGAAVVGGGWWRAAETVDFNRAVGGVSWALTGGFLVVVAVTAQLVSFRGRLAGRKGRLLGDWLLAGMAEERRRRRAVTPERSEPTGGASATVLVAPDARRYHRPGCAALESVTATRIRVGDLDASLAPCGLCLGD